MLHDGERLPTLVTPRLRLRWLEDRDLPALFAIYSDPQVTRYTSRPPQRDMAEARRYLDDIHRWFRERQGFQWGVALPDGDGVVGAVSLFHFDEPQGRAEVGYVLAHAAWGHGYAHEAMRALVGHAFDTLKLRRLEADVDPRNARSIRVMERLGFVREGLLRERWYVAGELQDSLLFGLLARDWHGGPPAGSRP